MCCEKRLAVWQGDGAWNERVKVQQKCLTTPSTKYKSATETKMTYVHTQCNYKRNNKYTCVPVTVRKKNVHNLRGCIVQVKS